MMGATATSGSLRNAGDDWRSMEAAACAVCQGLAAECAGCRVMVGPVAGPLGFVVRVRTGTRWLCAGVRSQTGGKWRDRWIGLGSEYRAYSFGERAGFARVARARIS